MKRGIVLIAHNTETVDYVKIAKYAALRAKRFLDLPVTLITDEEITDHPFDEVIIHSSKMYQRRLDNKDNFALWKNFDRYMAYEYSPYDHTLLLDTDYVINSNQLNSLWDLDKSFLCHNTINYISRYDITLESIIGQYQLQVAWATVVMFKRDNFTRALFDMWQMVQKNYLYYGGLYKFNNQLFRNDYALTIALNTVSGHLDVEDYTIKYPLLNVFHDVDVCESEPDEFEFNYQKIISNNMRPYKLRLKNTDFHCMNKFKMMELCGE